MTSQFFCTDMSFKHEQFEQACFDQTVQKLEREQASLMVKVEVGKRDVVSRTVYKGCANDGGRQDVLPGHKASEGYWGVGQYCQHFVTLLLVLGSGHWYEYII